MRSVAAHRARILGAVEPLPPVAVPVGDALGAVTAEDVVARLSVPRFDNAAMDGYAVRAADIAGPAVSPGSPGSPGSLPVAGVVAAGEAWPGPLPEGAALRIMTGAPMPAGADTVVPFETTDRGVDHVRIEELTAVGRHVRRAGEDVLAGAVVVPTGTHLRSTHLGLIAATGAGEVVVRPRPRVAVTATGAELLVPGADFEALPSDIPDSNTVGLMAAARAAGATVESYGPVPDDGEVLLDRLARAVEDADLVVTTGGISEGDHDVVKAALGDRAAMWFGSVAVKPGRPQGFGVLTAPDGRRVPLVCVPGTPVAAHTSFLLFAAPAIRVLRSGEPRWLRCEGRQGPRFESLPLAAPLTPSLDRTLVLPGRCDEAGGVVVLPGHAGHSQRLLADAEVLIVVPPGEPLAAGEAVDVIRP